MASREPIDFDPGTPQRVQAKIREQLGQVWDRISEADARRTAAGRSGGRGHLLAALYENAGQFNLEDVARGYSGLIPSMFTLTALANILKRSQNLAAIPGLLPATAWHPG